MSSHPAPLRTVVWGTGNVGRAAIRSIEAHPDLQLSHVLVANPDKVGRDHNTYGFTWWFAGGGFKAGLAYGATDEFGHQAIEDKVQMHDLHATILHQLGIDHKRLTYRHAGRDYRLTDVHGSVVREILG
jgi:hypothetical protein